MVRFALSQKRAELLPTETSFPSKRDGMDRTSVKLQRRRSTKHRGNGRARKQEDEIRESKTAEQRDNETAEQSDGGEGLTGGDGDQGKWQ